MKRHLVLVAGIAILVGASFAVARPSLAVQENDAQQEKLARQAKITKEQAQETALKRAPGNVESAELEREHGKLVYSFDIRNARGTIDEVQVSAITGRIVRVEHENKKQEAAEKRADQKKKQ
ncbi:MAG TPA: PepSY domain-containing protein [Pyrinomonadaceae bacterium]